MIWGRRKLTVKPDAQAKVEIVAHKKATKREVTKVKRANEALNNLFEDNHFTLKIYLASRN